MRGIRLYPLMSRSNNLPEPSHINAPQSAPGYWSPIHTGHLYQQVTARAEGTTDVAGTWTPAGETDTIPYPQRSSRGALPMVLRR